MYADDHLGFLYKLSSPIKATDHNMTSLQLVKTSRKSLWLLRELTRHLIQSLTCEEEEDEDHYHSVSKVEDGAGSSNYLQL